MASEYPKGVPPAFPCEWRHGCTREASVGLLQRSSERWLCQPHFEALTRAAENNGRSLEAQARAAEVFRRRRAPQKVRGSVALVVICTIAATFTGIVGVGAIFARDWQTAVGIGLLLLILNVGAAAAHRACGRIECELDGIERSELDRQRLLSQRLPDYD